MKRYFFIFLATFFLFLASKTGMVQASGGCVPVYGGGVQCPRAAEVLLDKKVRNPATGIFVDNLGLSDPKYRPTGIVTFRLYIKNTGDETIDRVTVTDKIPQFIDYMSGPGNYDNSSRTLTFTVDNLYGGTTRTFDIKGRIVHEAVLPAEKSVVCPVNIADADTSSQKDHDESQFCIEKPPVVPSVPKAGPEHWILSLGGLTTALSVGLYFRKKAFLA
ncbi:DUF11 domain-containing protein [Candidatus Microgenomates bacterium]|nr:DUF11 domain-containing protein [Candidatus Microgenomates bacterium]